MFKAHRLVDHSNLVSRVMKKKKRLVLELPEEVVDLYRGTSLINKRTPPGTTIGPYERGTPVRVDGLALLNSGCRM